MPRHCEECDEDLPDMVTTDSMVGSRGVKHCPFCGSEVA